MYIVRIKNYTAHSSSCILQTIFLPTWLWTYQEFEHPTLHSKNIRWHNWIHNVSLIFRSGQRCIIQKGLICTDPSQGCCSTREQILQRLDFVVLRNITTHKRMTTRPLNLVLSITAQDKGFWTYFILHIFERNFVIYWNMETI